MCKAHLFLKIIFSLLFAILAFVLSSLPLLWILFLYLLVLSIIDKNMLSLICEFLIFFLLLFFHSGSWISIVLPFLFLLDIYFLFANAFTSWDEKFLYYYFVYPYSKSSRRKHFEKYYRLKVLENEKKKMISLYGEDVPYQECLSRKYEHTYFMGKIRFFGYSNFVHFLDWKKFQCYDLFFFGFSFLIFLFLVMGVL